MNPRKSTENPSNCFLPDALASPKNSPMCILRAFAFLLFLTQVVLAQQPTPIVPDPKLTPGDTFDVTAQDLCVPGYAKKVRNVPEEVRFTANTASLLTAEVTTKSIT